MQDVGINLRRDRRRARLIQLIQELTATGMSEGQIAAAINTQRSYLAAMKAGTRGVGDALAARLEKEFGRPEGWMDQPFEDHDASTSKSVAEAMAVLVGALGAADDLSRIKVAGLLSRLADAQHTDRLRYASAIASELEPAPYTAVTWEGVCRSTVDTLGDHKAKDIVVAFLQLVDERFSDLRQRNVAPATAPSRRN